MKEEIKLLEETLALGGGEVVGGSVKDKEREREVRALEQTIKEVCSVSLIRFHLASYRYPVPYMMLLGALWSDMKDVSGHTGTVERSKADETQLNREVAELESLIESKIYREDELETRLAELEKEIDKWRNQAKAQQSAPQPQGGVAMDQSRSNSTNGTGTGNGEDRCELCEGPHDLDACPVFAGNTLGNGLGNGNGHAIGIREDKSPLAGKGGKWCADCEVGLGFPPFSNSDWTSCRGTAFLAVGAGRYHSQHPCCSSRWPDVVLNV